MGGGGGRQVLIVHRILQTIAKNHSQPVSVHDIAEACGVTREHAMRIFARATGTTIHDYLVRYRIATAQRLLATSDAKIGAIARDSGFSSEAPFYTAFRRIVGKSPWKYRTAITDRHSQTAIDRQETHGDAGCRPTGNVLR
jgi:transcriptional regulator GlxA family with amidase domain